MLRVSSSSGGKNRLPDTKIAFFPKKKGYRNKCAHLGSNQGPKDYESSVLLFFIAVYQVVMANTLFVAKQSLNKVG
jgi:hypothetical protein